jgi:uncharacterized protein
MSAAAGPVLPMQAMQAMPAMPAGAQPTSSRYGARRAVLADGRLHFQHGPIDLVITAEGEPAGVAAAHAAAWQRFETVLDELVAELRTLRAPLVGPCPLQGVVARRMWQACRPHRAGFITSMAAVAGAVADEIVAAYRRPGIERAWVNNGGDIALHLAAGRRANVGVVTDLAAVAATGAAVATDADFEINAALPVRGIATSGWRGRSLSRGIADSVTVLAATAAEADAAATVIANAVDCDDPRIERQPANTRVDDSDLGAIPVTVGVPPLDPAQVDRALQAGVAKAHELQRAGLVHAVLLVCQHRAAVVQAARSMPTRSSR